MLLTQEEKKIIIDILTEELEPEFIYIFGSHAIGEARIDSDIDIAMYQNNRIEPYKLFQLSNKIALRLKSDIDLISLKEVSTVFAAQIISKSEIIYSKDDLLRQNYSIKIFKEYAKLNEERKEILNSIMEDTSIYANDIILNKIQIIERCMIRIQEVYDNKPENLMNYTLQDSIVLNLQRAIEATIDIAMHIVSEKKLGLPQSSRDSFEILMVNGFIDERVLFNINNMIGFRNIVVHNYQKINLNILQNIIEKHLNDFTEFIESIKSI